MLFNNKKKKKSWIRVTFNGEIYWLCPTCNTSLTFEDYETPASQGYKCCPFCCQKLYWKK